MLTFVASMTQKKSFKQLRGFDDQRDAYHVFVRRAWKWLDSLQVLPRVDTCDSASQ